MNVPALMDLPWLAPACDTLRRARSAGRFPGALLIHEQPGAGGEWLARFAAQRRVAAAAIAGGWPPAAIRISTG